MQTGHTKAAFNMHLIRFYIGYLLFAPYLQGFCGFPVSRRLFHVTGLEALLSNGLPPQSTAKQTKALWVDQKRAWRARAPHYNI